MARAKAVSQPIGTPPPAVSGALRQVLRPLVRLLLDHGIGLPVLVDLLKEIYVNVAERDFPSKRRAQSDSRVSVMTGVHRKDVRRLRRQTAPVQPAPPSMLVGGQLLARWTGHRDYLDARGKPLKLARLRRDGGARSFEALAETVSRDVGPRAMLDELIRLGIARLEKGDRVSLSPAAFAPRPDVDESAFTFGKNLHDHLAAVAHNLRGDAQPFLERSVHYSNLSAEAVAELAKLAEQVAMKGLHQVSRRAMSLKRRGRGAQCSMHMNFGVFFYSGEDDGQNGEAIKRRDYSGSTTSVK